MWEVDAEVVWSTGDSQPTDPLLSDEVVTFEEFMQNEPQRAKQQHEEECGCDNGPIECGYGYDTAEEWYDESYLAYYPEAKDLYPLPDFAPYDEIIQEDERLSRMGI